MPADASLFILNFTRSSPRRWTPSARIEALRKFIRKERPAMAGVSLRRQEHAVSVGNSVLRQEHVAVADVAIGRQEHAVMADDTVLGPLEPIDPELALAYEQV